MERKLTASIRIKSRTSTAKLIVFCCDNMRGAVEAKTIIANNDHWFIRGKSEWMGDEETGYDDVSVEVEIQYCPFCGKKLNK